MGTYRRPDKFQRASQVARDAGKYPFRKFTESGYVRGPFPLRKVGKYGQRWHSRKITLLIIPCCEETTRMCWVLNPGDSFKIGKGHDGPISEWTYDSILASADLLDEHWAETPQDSARRREAT